MMVKRLEYRAIPIVALLLIALVFFLGIRSERTGFVDDVLDPSLKRITHPVLNAFRGKPPTISQMEIRLEAPEKDSLDAIEERALMSGWLEPQDNAVPCSRPPCGKKAFRYSRKNSWSYG